jgi:outer membrane protein TolC
LQAIHQEVIAREAFAHVLGENDADITLSGDLPRHDPPGELNLNEIVKDTPTHRIQLGQIDNARANIKLTDSAYYPSLNLNGGVQNGDQILYTNSDQQWFVGLSLTIPLFSGLSTYYSAKSAHDLERASVDTSLASDFTTYEGLRSALYSFQEAVQLLRVSQLSLRALSVQEKIATKQYNNGIMTFENWDIIEDNLVTAEKTALSSDEGRDLSESSWRLAEGLGDLP